MTLSPHSLNACGAAGLNQTKNLGLNSLHSVPHLFHTDRLGRDIPAAGKEVGHGQR